jgi:AraC-like DNA-binding protein
LTAVTKKLTKMTTPSRHRLWAELAEDSRLTSLRFGTLGWVPRKSERVTGVQDKFAVCVLRAGSTGTLRDEASGELRRVRGPGVIFVTPARVQDYGPATAQDAWEEFYWILEGDRVAEWGRVGWWDRVARFHPVAARYAADGWAVFREACTALESRDGAALDHAKLRLERWLSEGPWGAVRETPAAASPLAPVVEEWRRDLGRAWSPPDAARRAGLSYTRFRARFLAEYGQAPYAHLLRLRLELARRWLRSTQEPVKAMAFRCGFSRVEPFIRAFAKAHGATPARWRKKQAAAARAEIEDA